MDGSVIANMIEPEYFAAHPVASIPTYETGAKQSPPKKHSLSMEERQRLNSLGYL
ncbi:MAG: hypothetical protein M5R36_18440 [Deltaproteobacteria bacterium]|nr:hypothetical protein [Deltaproteobacteria bacterium]